MVVVGCLGERVEMVRVGLQLGLLMQWRRLLDFKKCNRVKTKMD